MGSVLPDWQLQDRPGSTISPCREVRTRLDFATTGPKRYQPAPQPATVSYIAATGPDDDDEWQVVLDRCDGRDDIYNFVPLTHDVEVQNLFGAQANAESSAEAGKWKGMFIAPGGHDHRNGATA